MKLTRRAFLLAATAGLFGGGYAFGVEPFRLRVTHYQPKIAAWPSDQRLRIVALADLHACEPWMTADRVRDICRQANALDPDIVVLLGDYVHAHRFIVGEVAADAWAEALATLSAPLGVHAILGNHDWWRDVEAQKRGYGPVEAGLALRRAGVPVLENDALRLTHNGKPFWLLGLGDQLAIRGRPRPGVDDLAGMLSRVDDAAPAIMLAHEPDVFARTPSRVALTLAGHTHAGQVRLFGWPLFVPSAYGGRYAYGHVVERHPGDAADRHLIVSAGLGCSILPVRFGAPPEIVVVDLGQG